MYQDVIDAHYEMNRRAKAFKLRYFNKEHKMLHRMADKVYILYWKGEDQDHIF